MSQSFARPDDPNVPKGVLGYAEATADQGSITADTDLTSLSVTVTVAASRRIRIKGHVKAQSDTASVNGGVIIKESTTDLAIDLGSFGATAGLQETFQPEAIITPSAGSHTYKLTWREEFGNPTVTVKASSTRPNFILVEDIGPA